MTIFKVSYASSELFKRDTDIRQSTIFFY